MGRAPDNPFKRPVSPDPHTESTPHMTLSTDSAARARAATPVSAQPKAQAQSPEAQPPQQAAAPKPASVPDTFSKKSGGGLFGDIIKGAGNVIHKVEHGVQDAIHTVGDLFKNDRE